MKDLDLEGHAYIIIAGDNGSWLGEGKYAEYAKPLSSWKTSIYDRGLRVPFIIRAPGKVPAGKTSDVVAATLDVFLRSQK